MSQVAADLYERYGDGVSSLSVMFPSRRASLFFGEALSGIIRRPLWQPASVTIDRVAGELSGLAVGDRLHLVVELFNIYREFHPAENFDTFYFWGELLLGDFDSIDKYLVDADMLFSNLVDLHEIDGLFDYLNDGQMEAVRKFWGSFSMNSPQQSDFLTVWRTLGPVYHRFRARLRELGTAYEGMVYREAAEAIRAGRAPRIPERHYVIAGFNALSRSEQTIFEHLKREFRVDFYWDRDDYFVEDRDQEAGGFMRDNLRRFPPVAPLSGRHDNFRKPKTIRSVATAGDVLQCKYAGLALARLARRTGRTPGRETAVVLCDESLLEPLLWSMPPEVEGINITMGYPLRMHPAYTFVERLIELQNRRRGRAFYHSDVEGLLGHPYLGGHCSIPPRYVYIKASRLHSSPIFERIFTTAGENENARGDWRALSEYLIGVISEVSRLPLEVADDGMGHCTAFFAIIVEHIRRLANSLEGCGVELSTKTYAALLRRSLQSVTVPFEGEPLEGVQVMGILETRALDFENIIFLSAGDGNMPGNLVGAPSFIPYNLKAAYSLPTPEHHEGVYAYHFFRLISRARRIDAVWSRTTDERSAGQPSRYILQLDYESPHEVEHKTVSVDVNLSPVEPIEVEKGAEVMSRLGEFTLADNARHLSPSLFYTYMECPLKFYFRGIARLRAEEEVPEEIDGALFGNILHHAMRLLYAPLTGVGDPRERIRALIGSEEVERAVTAAVRELYPGEEGAGPEDWGGNTMLARKTIVDYIDRGILPYDARLPESFTIERLEERIETAIVFGARNGGGDGGNGGGDDRIAPRTVIFSGIADRIDRLPDGTPRVVDYKTGNPKNNASALLQMGLYAMMLRGGGDNGGLNAVGRSTVGAPKIETALYYVRDMSKPDRNADGGSSGVCKVDDDPDGEFEETLRATLADLFDPAVPFTQTPDPKPCEWCDFRVICRR